MSLHETNSIMAHIGSITGPVGGRTIQWSVCCVLCVYVYMFIHMYVCVMQVCRSVFIKRYTM